MTDPATDDLGEPLQALRAELLRHARDTDALFHRAHRDHQALSAILVALSSITEALSQLDPSTASGMIKKVDHMDGQPKMDQRLGVDHELSDALERMTDPKVRDIFIRRLAELGYHTRPLSNEARELATPATLLAVLRQGNVD